MLSGSSQSQLLSYCINEFKELSHLLLMFIISINMTILSDEINNITASVDPTKIFGPQRDPYYIVIPITIIYTLIFITGLLGNIFTCIVIVRNKSMHTATNYYLFSLAISDLLLLVSGMPQEMYSIWSKWPYVFGYTFCVIRGLAAETSTNASVLTITLFTIERYLAICHPFVSHQMSKLSRATRHVLWLWVVAFGLALPLALEFGLREHKGVIMCLQTRIIVDHYFEISTFVFFFAPMVLITVLYSLIGLKLRETSKGRDQTEKDFEASIRYTHKIRRKHSQSTRKVVKMLVAVVIAFFICWAPFHAQRLVAIYGTTEEHMARSPELLSVYYFLTYISGIFYYMSTCINPIFYHIMSNKFRDAFKNTMFLCCCRSKDITTIKRYSYSAIAFVRNPTSSGTINSGNSLKSDPSTHSKNKRQKNREKINMHLCQNGRKFTPPKRTLSEISREKQLALISEAENIDINNENSDVSPVFNDTKTKLPETPEAIIKTNSEDIIISSKDDPNNYLKEIKLRIVHREKEYG